MAKLDLRPRSGPIRVMVDYRLAHEDIAKFLGLMADADNIDALRAMHRGEGLPEVHRMIERQTALLMDDTPLRDLPEV